MFDALNTAAMATFSESFTIGGVVLQGVFGDVPKEEHLGGAGFHDKLVTLQLPQSVVESHAIKTMQNAVVRAVTYQIVDLDADSTGMATLYLRRYS